MMINEMNREWKCVAFSSFFLMCICSTPVTANPTGGENAENLKPTITSVSQKFSVSLFGEAVLPCETENAANESIVWKFDGYVQTTVSSGQRVLIPFGNSYFSVAKNHSLRIKNFNLDMIGNYTCEILHKNVAVKHDIRLEDQPSKLMEVTEGDNFTLHCHPALQNSSQVPDEGDFEWVIPDGVPIYSNRRISPFLSLLDSNNNSLFAVDNSALIVRQIPYWDNLNLTCRLLRLHTNFTYVFQIRRNYEFSRNAGRFQISPQKHEGPVVLDCSDSESPEGSTIWVRRRIKENASFIKVISLNERILVRNNSAGFRIAENKSLIISNFKWTPKTDYKCYLSTKFTTYEHRTYGSHIIGSNALGRDDNNDDDEDPIDSLRIPTILVTVYPTDKNLVLNCPVGVGNHTEYEWIVKTWDEDFPDVFIVNGVNFRSKCRHECYNVNNDGSLIIQTLATVVNSTYTCRNRISGEQLAYNVALRYRVKPIKSISVEQGGNITLPCPASYPGDRELNAMEWQIELKDDAFKFPIILNIMEGKVLSPLSTFYIYEPVPRNVVIFAGDKESLSVTDFHSGLVGNYSCFWVYSGTRQTYTLELKSNSTYF